jgi:hypothetical protein
MPHTPTRRDALALGGSVAIASLAGCFGITRRGRPDEGTINIQDAGADWASGKTLRVVAQKNSDTIVDQSFTLPVGQQKLTIEPAVYSIQVYLGGERRTTYSWKVTKCQSILYVTVEESESEGVQIHTTQC